MGDLRQVLHPDIFGQRHPPAVNFKYFKAAAAVRDRNDDLAVESSRTPQGGVKGVRQVGGGDDDDVLSFVQAVHEGKKLGHNPLFHIADHVVAAGGDGVNLIKEQDARPLAGCFFKNLPEVRFAFAVKLVDDLRTADGKEVGLGFVGDGTGNEGFSASRGAVEEDALRCIDAEPFENLRIAQRQFNHFPDALQLGFQAADIFIGEGSSRFLFSLWFADDEDRGGVDDDRPLG